MEISKVLYNFDVVVKNINKTINMKKNRKIVIVFVFLLFSCSASILNQNQFGCVSHTQTNNFVTNPPPQPIKGGEKETVKVVEVPTTGKQPIQIDKEVAHKTRPFVLKIRVVEDGEAVIGASVILKNERNETVHTKETGSDGYIIQHTTAETDTLTMLCQVLVGKSKEVKISEERDFVNGKATTIVIQ